MRANIGSLLDPVSFEKFSCPYNYNYSCFLASHYFVD